MKLGRPTKCTPELTEELCHWLAAGKSLRGFCRETGAVDVATVCRWIVSDDTFRKQYAQAREAAGFAHADGIIEVVEMLRDNELDAMRGRAMMDGLKWAAERMAPKSHNVAMMDESPTQAADRVIEIIRASKPD